jgi:hypothetical protein
LMRCDSHLYSRSMRAYRDYYSILRFKVELK